MELCKIMTVNNTMTRYHGNVSKYLNLSEVRINQIFSYVIHFAGRYMFTTNDEQTLWLAGWLAGDTINNDDRNNFKYD